MGDHEQSHTHVRSKKPAVAGGGLDTKDETKILKNWGFLKKTLNIAHVIDPLIEKGIFTPHYWMTLKSKNMSEAERVEEFLYSLLKGKSDSYSIFLVALKSRGYTQVANQLEGIGSEDSVPPLSGKLESTATLFREYYITAVRITIKSLWHYVRALGSLLLTVL